MTPLWRVGRITYIDFKKQFAEPDQQFFTKRKSLAHELEVRVVLADDRLGIGAGQTIPVDLSTLLVAAVPSPFAPAWFTPLLDSVLKRYDISVLVMPSEILAEPFF